MYERNMHPSSLALLVFFLFTVFLQQACIAQKQEACGPSSCGKITNIRYPFRLKNDPPNCGNPNYELACENNMTVLYLYSGRYYVESINYNNLTIRLVDPGVRQTGCSSIPSYSLYQANFSDVYGSDPWEPYGSTYRSYFKHVVYLNCSNQVSDDPEYVDTASCINWNSNGHIYAIAGYLSAQKLKVDCRVMMIAASSLWGPDDYDYTHNQSFSYDDIHRALIYGFEVSWLKVFCIDHCGEPVCSYNETTKTFGCYRDSCYTPLGFPTTKCGNLSKLQIFAEENGDGDRREEMKILRGKKGDWKQVN
ncbi:hypothetical protein L6164_026292 [Bauhinia variegata]|uniref:Uncharacterized protein n=1 Tax=Bauhinia variegata TaxID=167791 RepID=A0ACB9LPN5_BAUVA|nr:hypothetical protein L6164_026292 [Bauhinia variegata]